MQHLYGYDISFTNSIIINDDPFYGYGAIENVEQNIIDRII